MPMLAWLLTGLAIIIVSANHKASFFLGAALVALIFAIPFWVAFLCLKIRITNWPSEVYGGSKLPFTLELNNIWLLPLININAQLFLQNTLNQTYQTANLITDLNPLNKVNLTWEVGPLPRGRYNLVGLRLLSRAPFGLISWSRYQQLEGTVKVFPVLLPVQFRYSSGGYAGSRSNPAIRRNTGVLPDGVRNYNPGDSLARIHWKVSARQGQLLSKSFREEKGGTRLLVVGYWENSLVKDYPAENEALITAAASLAWTWFQQSTEFHFILYAREQHNLGLILTQENFEQVLDVLTVALPRTEEHAQEGLASYVLEALQVGTGEVIVLTGDEQFETKEVGQQGGCNTVAVHLPVGLSDERIVEILEGVA